MFKLLVFVALLVAALASPVPSPKADPTIGYSTLPVAPLGYNYPYLSSYNAPTVYSAPLSYASIPYSAYPATYNYGAYRYVL